ncbi:MAG: tRNA dihydrouridine synthase DusB [Clostridia bacterium]|nr:tRNA dihydrouridine synthase DusB [Clostridia bacterium]
MKIGNYTFKYGLSLAPMAGVTDRAYRALCVRYGAELVTTELISAKAVTMGDQRTFKLASLTEEESPAAIQIFGSDPAVMGEAAYRLMSLSPAMIDINMGCPVHKIIRNGEGCALMRDIDKAATIVAEVVKSVSVPVTVKMRIGMDENSLNAPQLALACQQAGAAAVTVHGRTRDKMYSGTSDCGEIRKVKHAVDIPVIASGDVGLTLTADEAYSLTEADGIAVGRAAMGAPWIFAYLIDDINGVPRREIRSTEKLSVIKEHIDRLLYFEGERALCQMRTHLSWYTKGLRGSAALRRDINTAVTKSDFYTLAEKVFEE